MIMGFLRFKFDATQEELNYAKTICNEIRKQIMFPDKFVFFSWGADKFAYGVGTNGYPILRFKVNGMKFKGYVHIIYNPLDYYEVEFVSTHGNLKKRYDEVYFDELQEKIDEYVEKIPAYSKQKKKSPQIILQFGDFFIILHKQKK